MPPPSPLAKQIAIPESQLFALLSMAERCAGAEERARALKEEVKYRLDKAQALQQEAEQRCARAEEERDLAARRLGWKKGELFTDRIDVLTAERDVLRARVGELEHRLASLGQTAAKLAGRKDLSDEEAVAKLLTVESNCLTWMTSCVACAETIDREHARWEEQQRRIAELERERDAWKAQCEADERPHVIAAERDTALDRLARATAALEWYADPTNWKSRVDELGFAQTADAALAILDAGQRARDALKAMRKGK